MHLLLFAETHPSFFPKLEDWIQSRKYPIGVKNPQIRLGEFKLLNITFPREWKEPFLKDIGRWCKGNAYKRRIPDDRFKAIYNNFLFQQALKKSKIEPIDWDELTKMPTPTTAEQGNPQFRAYLYPIGFIKDRVVRGLEYI